jgi:cytochrome c biogenesis protein CcdA
MMTALILGMLGLALVDSVNPSLFVTQFYLLTTERPLPRMASYIAGVLLVNLAAGLVVLMGIQFFLVDLFAQITPRVWRSLELLAGLVLVGVGLAVRGRKGTERSARLPRSLHPLHTFLLGAVITMQEVVTAAPYLIAIERIAQAQLSLLENLLLLALYNAIYIAPLLIVIGVFVASGTRMLDRLARINRAISIWLPRLFGYVCLLAGAALTIDALRFFLR